MNTVVVLDLFKDTKNRGEIAILDFPNNYRPKIGVKLKLKRSDDAIWTTIGIVWPPKLSDETQGYKHLEPSRLIWDCLLRPEDKGTKLNVGDVLSIMPDLP
jgi:hypothetical protein